ncbi:MAG: transposase [Acidobacteria bacterium]|nr:transposase [Acidobacteriota bacterium]
MLKRAHKGTFHKLSPKHLQRYVDEFAVRHGLRSADTMERLRIVVRRMLGRRLRYRDLIAKNGLPSGARA